MSYSVWNVSSWKHWKSRAVEHSAIRTKRQAEQRPKKPDSSYFLNSEAGASSRRNNAPKNRGRRLHLELDTTASE